MATVFWHEWWKLWTFEVVLERDRISSPIMSMNYIKRAILQHQLSPMTTHAFV